MHIFLSPPAGPHFADPPTTASAGTRARSIRSLPSEPREASGGTAGILEVPDIIAQPGAPTPTPAHAQIRTIQTVRLRNIG